MNTESREWSIQGLARISGTTSCTLRHYQSVGLLEPGRLGAHGMRYYDDAALGALLNILVLRRLGFHSSASKPSARVKPSWSRRFNREFAN